MFEIIDIIDEEFDDCPPATEEDMEELEALLALFPLID